MRRVLFLAYHFPPIGGSCVQRNVRLARYLPDSGYEMVVVTGRGTGGGVRWTPIDETLFRWLPHEAEVHRIAEPEPPVSRGWRARGERWLELGSPHVAWWNTHAVDLGRALGADVDLIHASLEPYGCAESAVRLARELGKPWVADLQDPWALDEMWVSPTRLHRRRELSRMRTLLSSAAGVVMNTPEAAARFRARFPTVATGRVHSVTNGYDAEDFTDPAPQRNDGVLRLVHTGHLHTERGRNLRRAALVKRALGGAEGGVDILTRSLVFLLDAIDRLLAARPEFASRIELHLAGSLTAGDRETLGRASYVRLHGYLPHDETIALIRSADLLFLPMHDLAPGRRSTIVPMKTYEYLGSGRPILAAVPDGDARDLLAAAGTATLCRPDDSVAMAAGIEAAFTRMAAGTPPPVVRADVLGAYERRQLTSDLASVFDAVLGIRAVDARALATA